MLTLGCMLRFIHTLETRRDVHVDTLGHVNGSGDAGIRQELAGSSPAPDCNAGDQGRVEPA